MEGPSKGAQEYLNRNTFKEEVFKRDKVCVWCGLPPIDAHHIIDRKCWNDGGYYINNGVALCELCHKLAESGEISCEDLRRAAKISTILPPNWDLKKTFDKWGNDVSIFKYPRTFHFPWSEKLQNDDRLIESLDGFIDEDVVVTEKMDGEGTSLYRDYIHARSPSPMAPHPSRNRIKELHSRIKYDIPEGWRICGENVYAKHSIYYEGLPDYFLVFSIWNEDTCLNWDETQEWCDLLGLYTVPVLYRGVYDEAAIKTCYSEEDWDTQEGYV